jgi:hypothetical protein
MDFHALFEKTFLQALKLLQSPFWGAEDFCHYTNLQGLIGIVENNELWLSDHRFVNDELEYQYGKQLTISVISEMANSEGDSEFSGFLQRLLESIQEPSSQGVYIGSMSFSPDKLDQWKGYGNSSESICIKFAGDFELWNAGNSHPTHIRQQRVIYDECKQKDLISAIIQIFKEHFGKFRQFPYPFLKDLTWLIESQFILFKHPEYASENELRLTIANLNHILDTKKPKHRVAKGMVIPYISTKYISKDANPELKRLPIKEIIVSPTSRNDLLESVRVFVANMGYTDVQVVESRIKFRG